MEQLIKQAEKKALSNTDLENITDHKFKVYVYDDLKNINTLDEALGPNGAFILLYESQPNFGHWTCCLRTHDDKSNNLIEFFDSYNTIPDKEFNFIPEQFKKAHYLSRLLKESPYELSYNNHKFQKMKEDINTCGRWCAMRCNFKDLSLEEFKKMMTNDKYDYDSMVTLLCLLFE